MLTYVPVYGHNDNAQDNSNCCATQSVFMFQETFVIICISFNRKLFWMI